MINKKNKHLDYWESKIQRVTIELFYYIEAEDFKGWDPYDGLNSKLFKGLHLDRVQLFRHAWIQLFKRNPINLRRLALVPKGYNPKGIGLILSAYSKLLVAQKANIHVLPKSTDILIKINYLANLLISMKSEEYSGACWGYNFDWQARGGLFFKSKVPTVVATTYAAYGLFDAYEATGEKKFLETALDAANFVLKDLNRDNRKDGSFLFSYSVHKGNDKVYNASLLGSKLLARAYHYNKDKSLIAAAKSSVIAVLDKQESDGSWVYGEAPFQNWKDSYHTGFNLESLYDYMIYSGDNSVKEALELGLMYYFENFFTESGIPKYYHDKIYPVDIHSPAQLLVTVSQLDLYDDKQELVDKVVDWTIANMFDSRGYFYYQIKSKISSKIPYMRWSQAWMAHALAVYCIDLKK